MEPAQFVNGSAIYHIYVITDYTVRLSLHAIGWFKRQERKFFKADQPRLSSPQCTVINNKIE